MDAGWQLRRHIYNLMRFESSTILLAVLLSVPAGFAQTSGVVKVASKGSSSVENIRFWQDGSMVRVVIDVTLDIKFKAGEAKSPERYFVDLSPARLNSRLTGRSWDVVSEDFRKIRVAQYDGSTVRVVLDGVTMRDVETSTLKEPNRIVLDVTTVNTPPSRNAATTLATEPAGVSATSPSTVTPTPTAALPPTHTAPAPSAGSAAVNPPVTVATSAASIPAAASPPAATPPVAPPTALSEPPRVATEAVPGAFSENPPNIPQHLPRLQRPNRDSPLYIIQPGDVLEIAVWKQQEISRKVTVRPDGRISIPTVQDLHAAGLNPMQLKAKVEGALSGVLEVPDVTVMVEAIRSYTISVGGRVAKPGPIMMEKPINVLQAIILAGGFTDYAKESQILVLRGQGEDSKVYEVDFRDVLDERHPYANILLRTGDVLWVQ